MSSKDNLLEKMIRATDARQLEKAYFGRGLSTFERKQLFREISQGIEARKNDPFTAVGPKAIPYLERSILRIGLEGCSFDACFDVFYALEQGWNGSTIDLVNILGISWAIWVYWTEHWSGDKTIAFQVSSSANFFLQHLSQKIRDESDKERRYLLEIWYVVIMSFGIIWERKWDRGWDASDAIAHVASQLEDIDDIGLFPISISQWFLSHIRKG